MKCLCNVYLTGYEDKLLKLPDIFSLAVGFGQESPKSEKLCFVAKKDNPLPLALIVKKCSSGAPARPSLSSKTFY